MPDKTITAELLNTGEFQGSARNYNLVKSQIEQRWGESEGKEYDPAKNCKTYLSWQKLGFSIKKGEKALKAFTFIRKVMKNEEGEIVKNVSYPKVINLFYYKQLDNPEMFLVTQNPSDYIPF